MSLVNEESVMDAIARFSLEDVSLPAQMVRSNSREVVNNAGGYVYKVNDENRIRRFLILGTEGGTYYCSEKQLAYENCNAMIKIIKKGKGRLLLNELVAVSVGGRAPKQNSTLMSLALCCKANLLQPSFENWSEDNKKVYINYIDKLVEEAHQAVPKVCRIPTHLFDFVSFCELICKSQPEKSTGWGKRMKKMIASWYLDKSVKELVVHITKYQQRNGWSHRDLLRLAHVKPNKGDNSLLLDHIFHFITYGSLSEEKNKEDYQPAAKIGKFEKGTEDNRQHKTRAYEFQKDVADNVTENESYQYLKDFIELKAITDEFQTERVIELIRRHNYVREHVPTQYLTKRDVWAELLKDMPMTALLRNLGKLSQVGLFGTGDEDHKTVEDVVSKLTDPEKIKKSRLHPLTILNGLETYKTGRGLKGKLEWPVNQKIVDALDKAFYLGFKNVQPTGKRYCLAFDVSGSMGCNINDSSLSCAIASMAMGMVFLKTESDTKCMAFSSKFTPLDLTADMTLDQVTEKSRGLPFDSTDCAQPMLWAAKFNHKFDVFIVFTDSETYEGKIKAVDAMKKYRKKMELSEAKLIVMGMTSTGFTIADPEDKNMLDVVGFDTAVPEMVRSFVMGEI